MNEFSDINIQIESCFDISRKSEQYVFMLRDARLRLAKYNQTYTTYNGQKTPF